MKRITLLLIFTIGLLTSCYSQNVPENMPQKLQQDIKSFCKKVKKPKYTRDVEPIKTRTPNTNEPIECFGGYHKTSSGVVIFFHMDIFGSFDETVRDITITFQDSSDTWRVEYNDLDDSIETDLASGVDDATVYAAIAKIINDVGEFSFIDDKRSKL